MRTLCSLPWGEGRGDCGNEALFRLTLVIPELVLGGAEGMRKLQERSLHQQTLLEVRVRFVPGRTINLWHVKLILEAPTLTLYHIHDAKMRKCISVKPILKYCG